jgi:hypothetical protein
MVGNAAGLEVVSVCVPFRHEILEVEVSSLPVDWERRRYLGRRLNHPLVSVSSSFSCHRVPYGGCRTGTIQEVQLTVYGRPMTNERRTRRSVETRIG